jgi:hypothetical protein
MTLTFPEGLTDDEKLDILFNYYDVKPTVVPKEDKEVLIIALNQPDVVSVTIDDEGAIEIIYDGAEWPKPPEDYE